MKVCVLQPAYSFDPARLEECFREMTGLLDRCDESMDLIVLPEYCDVPAAVSGAAAFHAAIERYNAAVRQAVTAAAKRCHAMVFANFAFRSADGWRNTTFAFDREGNERGRYEKAHPAPSEVGTAAQGGNKLDCSYSYTYRPPYVLEMEGLRFGFMTCYDFYMYEGFAALAREKVDIIIGCSHQRTDTHNALDVIGRFLCYNTNAYLVRAAVSLGENSPVCGCSMVVSPRGEMLLNMENRVGLGVCEIDPQDKYYKPAGFHGRETAHYEYIDAGRRPWLYRPGGSMTVPGDAVMPYPRICAHRGFNTVAPENSLPAFGAAVALGAQEIEFDIRPTADGELISLHDGDLGRVSDGVGHPWEYTLEELRQLDFGSRYGEHYAGLRITTFEEILRKFACTVIMNIHVKLWDEDLPDPMYEKIAALLHQYDCERHAYVMSASDKHLEGFHRAAPHIARCVGRDGSTRPADIVERAIRLGCEKVQICAQYADDSVIAMAKAHGIRCNVFYADDPEEACRLIDRGVDTVLTNDYLTVANAVTARLAGRSGR